jgi:hypothetical protein
MWIVYLPIIFLISKYCKGETTDNKVPCFSALYVIEGVSSHNISSHISEPKYITSLCNFKVFIMLSEFLVTTTCNIVNILMQEMASMCKGWL